ncbi:hypothetical protein BCD67_12810 [Oscillatoriales cyanobacterium USR001]|nr:hypothetical protein BCD67_12810 [Oscillatoriales cyanobacterium USR001]
MALIGFSTWKKSEEAVAANGKKPNVVLIVIDDLGYSDLTMYGGEVPTPNIESLAKSGTMFTNFHVAPTCSPSRSMLLTGVDNHRNGLGTMAELLTPAQEGKPGYEGVLNNRVIPISELLKNAGYNTYMAGKWHLGHKDGQRPAFRGFNNSFALIQGGGSHFNMIGETLEEKVSMYFDNDQPLKSMPPNFYSSQYYTDTMIKYIDQNRANGKPFFAYSSYTAVHVPLMVPDKYINKYLGKYDMGWDKLREQRFNRQKQLGIIPDYLTLPPRWPMVPAWDSLSAEEKKRNSKIKAIYAGMLDCVDENIGRLIKHLKDIGEYDNTLFVLISDNGASGLDFVKDDRENYEKWFKEVGIDTSYENMGRVNSYVTLGLNWAQVSTTPLKWSKTKQAEGGTRVPAIISYPRGGVKSGVKTDAFAHQLNLVPTILNYTGVKHPGTTYQGRQVFAPEKPSLAPLLEGKATYVFDQNTPIGQEVFGNTNDAMVLGDWKILRLTPPWGDNKWALYNLRIDPREINDLSQMYPEQLKKMVGMYEKYKKDNGFVPAK